MNLSDNQLLTINQIKKIKECYKAQKNNHWDNRLYVWALQHSDVLNYVLYDKTLDVGNTNQALKLLRQYNIVQW